MCGSGSYVYYHGMDYDTEYRAMRRLYSEPDEAELDKWGVDYVLFDSYVRENFSPDEEWYAARFELWYTDGVNKVYKTG